MLNFNIEHYHFFQTFFVSIDDLNPIRQKSKQYFVADHGLRHRWTWILPKDNWERKMFNDLNLKKKNTWWEWRLHSAQFKFTFIHFFVSMNPTFLLIHNDSIFCNFFPNQKPLKNAYSLNIGVRRRGKI